MLPVVGDEGEVLDVDEAVEVEVAGGPGGGGLLPIIGDQGLILDIDDAIDVGVAEVGEGDQHGVLIDELAAERCPGQEAVVEEADGVVGRVGGGSGTSDAFAGPSAAIVAGFDGGGEGGGLGLLVATTSGLEDEFASGEIEGGGEGGAGAVREGRGWGFWR